VRWLASLFVKRDFPVVLMAFFTAYFFVDYFITWPLDKISEFLLNTAVLCTALAVGVGIINVLGLTWSQVKKRDPYWYLRIWSVVMMVVTTALGLIGVLGTGPEYKWIMVNVYSPIDATIYAMVAFDIASAFYRTIRARTLDATIILICATLVMLKNAPIGAAIWSGFDNIGSWIFDIPSTAGSRGFIIIGAIGAVGIAIRALLGREREMFGD
jgi:hypothetical protein